MTFPEYDHCELCPRRCGADRNAGQRGFCGEGAALRVAAIEPHFGEEPPLTGATGSGTIFFSGCSCGCFFCQNYQLSREHLGDEISVEEAVARILAMAERGVRNLNLVTPDHCWPAIREVIRQVRAAGCTLPWIWNSSGYCRTEMLREQMEHVDIFMPDFKFADPELARRCMGREDYPQVAREAMRVLVDAKGFLRPFDATGEMPASCGVLVRHLVLPGQVENSLRVLDILFEDFGSRLPLSVMRQYRPMPECHSRGFLDRMVTSDEYAQVLAHVEELGFTRVFIQPESGDENFVPDFRHSKEPFKGNALRKAPRQPNEEQTK